MRTFEAASRIAVARIVLLLLLDNLSWFLWTGVQEHYVAYSPGFTLDASERAVIEVFREPRYAGYLVVSQSAKLGYLATVYSPLRSWCSHRYSTPHAELRETEIDRFFAYGAEPGGWHDRPVLAVAERDRMAPTNRLKNDGFHPVLANDRFVILARAAVVASTQ